MTKVYQGLILFTKHSDHFEIFENGAVVVEDGKVVEVLKQLPEAREDLEVLNMGDRLIIPGFVDLHFHAPQFPNLGLGLDKELLPWLEDYTFPEEAKYSNLDYARAVYTRVAKEIWRQGTTRMAGSDRAFVCESQAADYPAFCADLYLRIDARAR